MANLSQIFVALYNASTGGYSNQFKPTDVSMLSGIASMVNQKDLSGDTAFLNNLLSNVGISTGSSLYTQAFSALQGIVNASGRGTAVTTAIDYLVGAAKDSTNAFNSVGSAFIAKVANADQYTALHPYETSVSNLVGGATGIGGSLVLTNGTDTILGTSTKDIITAPTETLATTDKIIDSSRGDGDVLNITFDPVDLSAVPQPTITNIENINVSFDATVGAAFDATNVTGGATITLSSPRAAFAGDVTVTAQGYNNIAASGANLAGTLTVTGSQGGYIDIGSEKVLKVTATKAAQNAYDIRTNGATETLTLTSGDTKANTTANVLAITAAKDTTATVTSTDSAAANNPLTRVIGIGTGAITIKADTQVLDKATVSGVANVTFTAATTTPASITGFGSTPITWANTTTATLSNVSGQTITMSLNNEALTLTEKTALNSGVTVNVNADQSSGTLDISGTTGFGSSTINTNTAVTAIGTLKYSGTGALNIAQDLTVTSLTNKLASDTLTVSGTGSLTVTGIASTAVIYSVAASGLTGGLTFTNKGQTTLADTTITGGQGADKITVINIADKVTVNTGTGADSITASGVISSGTFTINSGDGNDTLSFSDLSSLDAAKFVINAGTGDDSIKLGATGKAIVQDKATSITIDGGDGADSIYLYNGTKLGYDSTGAAAAALTTGKVAITNVENLNLADSAGTYRIESSVLSGNSYALTGKASNATLNVIILPTTSTVDLSGMSVPSTTTVTLDASNAGVSVTIKGTGGADTVTTSGMGDTISTGAGKDNVTGDNFGNTVDLGSGDDTFTVVAYTVGTSTTDVVTTGTGKDTIDMSGLTFTATTKAGKTVDVTDFTAGTGGDLIKLTAANIGGTPIYDATLPTTEVVSVALAKALGTNIAGVENYIIADTAAHINAGKNVAATGIIAVATDTGNIYFSDTGDFTDGTAIIIAHATITGTLTSDNFAFV